MADGRSAGVFRVGYRASSLAGSGLLTGIFLLATVYTGFFAFHGAVFLLAAFVVCGLGTLFIGSLQLRAVTRALTGAPLLSLDREGVTLHSARVSLPWSNLKEIRIGHPADRGPNFDTLVFVPADESAAIETLRGLPRWFARDGIKRVGGPIFVRAGHLALPIEDIVHAARQWTSAPVRHHHALSRRPARIFR